MSSYTFILSDESVNSYGVITLTEGINIEQFKKNPIMLYMHEQGKVIGKWENIRKIDGKLIADACFDESSEFTRSIKNQVDNGILRAVSIGADKPEIDETNTTPTIISCVLCEASIVDIPANNNCLKLNKKSSKIYLSREMKTFDNSDILSQIKAHLGLNEERTYEDILKALAALKTGVKTEFRKNVEIAFKLNLITNSDIKNYIRMDEQGKQAFDIFCKRQVDIDKNNVNQEVSKALELRKFLPMEQNIFQELGNEIGAERLKKVLACVPGVPQVVNALKGGKDYDRKTWGLTEYRKYAPDELKNNPDLYHFLLENENDTGVKSLDWYRRNNPDYLRENPKEYRRLLNEEKQLKNGNQ